MMVVPPIFTDKHTFEQQFLSGLEKILQQPDLGSYILALANCSLSEQLFTALQIPLQKHFADLQNALQQSIALGAGFTAAEDDLVVFLKLCLLGFPRLQLAEQKTIGHWQKYFNHIRSFRPQRMTRQIAPPLQVDFQAQGFHFDKAFLQKEALWEGDYLGLPISLYYNKYPFTDFHCLLIPDKAAHWPQYLTESLHHYLFELMTNLHKLFPNLKIGYNAMGAFCSVNHCHFQWCLPDQPFPIEHPRWQHNGGKTPYPVTLQKLESATSSWSFITTLHQQQQPYNLLYTSDGCYVIPRKVQGSYITPSWSSGFTWFELSGGAITFNWQQFTQLTDKNISISLQEINLPL